MGTDSQGNPTPQEGQGNGDEPKFVTEEQLNKAITARFGAFEKKTQSAIEGAFKSFSEGLDSKLAELKPKPVEPGDPKTPELKIDDHPIVKGLQKQLADLAKTNELTAQKAAGERSKARDTELRRKLQDELSKHGFKDANLSRHAVGFLADADKRVRFADDDSDDIVFRDQDGTEVDLTTGVKSWARSDDAKIYLPPSGATGSGDRGGGRSPNGGAPKMQRGDLGTALAESVGNGMVLRLGGSPVK